MKTSRTAGEFAADPSSSFDLAAYVRRIGHEGPLRADLATLRALHRRHVEAIPFENLDIQMGGAIRLDPASLQAKMVGRRRGGYCFEHNALFALALESVGFAPERCEARVRQNAAGAVRPRTHMVLVVPCEGRPWLADVGFGGDGLLEPLPLDGSVDEQAGVAYRVAAEGGLRVLQRAAAQPADAGAAADRGQTGWEDLYAIMPEPVHAVDFEMANWFTSTFPRSPFVLHLTAQRTIGGTRHVLRDLAYSVTRGSRVETRRIARAEVAPLLRDVFGLDVPQDTRFRALDEPPTEQ
jgi:N-hydroxyarylamine O-acetyltransferase